MKTKMKRVFGLVLAIVFILVSTGCVKYEMNMGVNEDKSVDFEVIYAIDSSSMDGLQESNDEENETDLETEEDETSDSEADVSNYEFLKNKGYTVEEYEQTDSEGHKYKGVKIKKRFASIDDITKETEKTIDINNKFFNEEKFDDSQIYSKNGDTYKASLLFDFTENGKDVSDQYKEYQSMFTLSYTVKLPSKATDNNATKVSDDGKTLTWEFAYGKKTEVKYSFELKDSDKKEDKKSSEKDSDKDEDKTKLFIIIGAGVGGLLLIIIIVIVIISSKKKNPTTPTTPTDPTNPTI